MFRSRVWTGTLVLLLAVMLGVSACAEPVEYAPSGYVGYGYPSVDGLGWGGRRLGSLGSPWLGSPSLGLRLRT
jgi:hypothetical protein